MGHMGYNLEDSENKIPCLQYQNCRNAIKSTSVEQKESTSG